jgi:hypothetical protein
LVTFLKEKWRPYKAPFMRSDVLFTPPVVMGYHKSVVFKSFGFGILCIEPFDPALFWVFNNLVTGITDEVMQRFKRKF